MSEKLLDTDETLRLLNISRTTLYQWMKQNIINPVDMYPAQLKRRPQLKFREEDVKKLMPTEPAPSNEEDEPENKVA